MVYSINIKRTLSSEGKEIWGKFTQGEVEGPHYWILYYTTVPMSSVLLSFSLFLLSTASPPLSLSLCLIGFSSLWCGYKELSLNERA